MKKVLKFYSILLVISSLMGITAMAADGEDFDDVSKADYFYDAVKWGVDSGITYGVDENSFNPQGEVTRAQAVTFLWRMEGEPEAADAETFIDVEEGSWYENAVKWAVENEITAGTGDGMFSPDVVCDRAMCITLLYRIMGSPFDGVDFTADVELNENSTMEDFGFYIVKGMVESIREEGMLSDVPEESYFELPVFWGLLNGIITEDNTGITEENVLFRPTEPCVRGEMISFLYQAKQLKDMQNAPIEAYFDQNVLPVPQEYWDSLYFYYYGDGDEDEELLLTVSEVASVEAAAAMGEEDTEGVGEIFSIVRVSEDRLHDLLCGDMSGMRVFARNEEGNYYIFNTPTDVRYVRETNEAMDADINRWIDLNEWARGELCNEIIDMNDNLEPVSFTNTTLDMYLARIAYDNYTNYTISAKKFGELKSKKVDAGSYAEKLLEGNFVELEDMEAPEGEYITLNFPEDNVHFDFFTSNKNIVREVYSDYEILYKRGLEGGENNTDTMQEWYFDIAEKRGKK